MNSVKRRINFTGRKRIQRECIEIEMLELLLDEPLRVKASIDLHTQEFPETASVVLEAYRRSSSMRFEFGTIGTMTVPEILVLSEIDRGGSVLFRLKVVDNDGEPGRLLGSAERIKPRNEEEDKEHRCILPVVYRDLRHDVWKVEIEQDNRPKLIINTRLPSFRHKLDEDPMLQGTILPAALRFILHELVEHSGTENDDESDWEEDWLVYCQDQLGVTDDPREILEEDHKKDWIDNVVMQFCGRAQFVEKIRTDCEEI